MERFILLLATLLTAILAGLFYAWSCSVMPGLARLTDTQYLHALQAMNRAILNPVFFLSFLGSSLLLPLCAWQQSRSLGTAGAALVIVAAIVHWIGMMGVTVFGNIPINNLLDTTDLGTANASELTRLREAFQGTWVRLNNVRTAAAILALVLLLIHGLRGWTSTPATLTTP
jgi:uncharacterized membrane protein